MRGIFTQSVLLAALLLLGPLSAPAQVPVDLIQVGDRIDVTLATGVEYPYAKVLDVSKDSLVVANSQGIRSFAAESLSPDLRARLPGATPPAPVRAPVPQAPPATEAPVPSPASSQTAQARPDSSDSAIDLDSLASLLAKKIQAQQAPSLPSPAAVASANHAKAPAADFLSLTIWQALLVGLLLIVPTLNILATRSILLKAPPTAIPVWILAIWLLPLIGSFSAFVTSASNERKSS